MWVEWPLQVAKLNGKARFDWNPHVVITKTFLQAVLSVWHEYTVCFAVSCASSWHQQGDAGQEEASGVSDQELHEGKPAQTGAAVEQLSQPEVWLCPVAEQHFVLEMHYYVAILTLIF